MLELDDARFRHDTTFQGVIFNQIQRAEARQKIFLMLRKKHFSLFVQEFKSLTIMDIEKAQEIYLRTGNLDKSNIISRLFTNVQSASARVQGSKAALFNRRMDLRGYIVKFGLPMFYITINPADVHNPLMLFLAGEKVNLDTCSINKAFYRMKIVKRNPYSQAKFFDMIITNFINLVLCYSPKLNKEGIIGLIRAIYAMVEAGDRGALHSHFVIWIVTLLSPTDMGLKLQCENFRQLLCDWVDTIIKCDLDDFIERESSTTIAHPCSRSLNLDLCKSPNDLDRIFKIATYEIVKASNIHKCCFTCKKFDCACRFGFPLDLIVKTSIAKKSGEIEIKRNDPNINYFNPTISSTVKCNTDVRILGFLTNNSLLNVIYYLTNYMTKFGLTTYDSFAYAIIAFKKYELYKDKDDTDSTKARRIISMMYNAAANRTEYSGAQIASMIRNNGRDGTFYSSHKTITINLVRLLAIMNSLDDSNDLISIPYQFKNDYRDFSVVHDYEQRPNELENKCFYEFISQYTKVKSNQIDKKYMKFNNDHHQSKTHQLKRNEEELVPCLYGPTIPRKSDSSQKDLYAKVILVLFRPWKRLIKINQNETQLLLDLDIFLISLQKEGKNRIINYIDNLEYLKKSLDDANEVKRDKLKKSQFFFQNKDFFTNNKNDEDEDEDLLIYAESDIDNLEIEKDEDNKEVRVKTWINIPKDVVKKYFNITKTIDSLHDSQKNDQSNIITITNSKHAIDIDQWKKQLLDYKKNGYPKDVLPPNTLPSLLRINDAEPFKKIPKLDVLTNDELTKAVIEKFKLDESQQISFNLFTSLLYNNNSPQMIQLLTGDGGVGKTETVKAIEYFFKKNNATHKLMLSSTMALSANLMSEASMYLKLLYTILKCCIGANWIVEKTIDFKFSYSVSFNYET